jgi:hypothetical protein
MSSDGFQRCRRKHRTAGLEAGKLLRSDHSSPDDQARER